MQNNDSCRATNPAEPTILQNNKWNAGAGCKPSSKNFEKTPSTLYAEQQILQNNESRRTTNPAEQQVERRGRLRAFRLELKTKTP